MKYGMTESVSGELNENNNSLIEEKVPNSSPILVAMSSKANTDSNTVVFSIQFYGKTIGEVGLMDPDLSQLDWKKFKEYLFQNLLSVQSQDNISVMYSDEEGDKLPIDCDEEYQEALKVAKRKAEINEKLVLDISRQGRLPMTVLNLASSAIKRVSSSPPKDGGISFFKHSTSPPKENISMPACSLGAEKRVFPGFFLHNKGPVPGHAQGLWEGDCDEALEDNKAPSSATTKTTTVTATPIASPIQGNRGPPVRGLKNSPGKIFQHTDWSSCNISESHQRLEGCCINCSPAQLLPPHSSRTSALNSSPEHSRKSISSVRQKTFPYTTEGPPPWFIAYMENFRSSLSEEIVEKVYCKLVKQEQQNPQNGSELPRNIQVKKNILQTNPTPFHLQKQAFDPKEEDSQEHNDTDGKEESNSRKEKKMRKKKEKCEETESSAKRKKLAYEEEKLTRKIDKMEKAERKKIGMKYQDELDKATRKQEKVLAKMEGLRKKQSCSPEELNKLRKMVDKHNSRVSAQIRHNERKLGSLKQGRNKKINIDNKAFPVDASLLHTCLHELEVLAEDSPNESCGGAAATRGFDATYLYDVTIPDGSLVQPGQEFVKTWRVCNSGVMTWNEKTMLCKWSQVHFCGSPAGWKLRPNMKKVVCPGLEPGQEGDISITFIAPSEPGWYATHWRFCQRGRVFGNQMWCAVRVNDESENKCQELNQTKDTTVGHETEASKGPDMSCGDLTEVVVEQPASTAVIAEQPASTAVIAEQPASTAVIAEESESATEFTSAANKSNNRQEDLLDLLDTLHINIGQQTMKNASIKEEFKVTDILSKLEISDSEFMDEASSDICEVNIVENYYDAESTPHRTIKHSTQQVCEVSSLGLGIDENIVTENSGIDDNIVAEHSSNEYNTNTLKDLISFEEEAVILESGFTTPEIMEASGQQSVVACDIKNLSRELDVLSLSSESCSELDSEDQAIMNESDSEGSDQEYYLLNVPDCFNLDQPFNGLIISYESDKNNHSPKYEGSEESYFFLDQEDMKNTSSSINSEPLPSQSFSNSDTLSKDDFHQNTEVKCIIESNGVSVSIPESATDAKTIEK